MGGASPQRHNRRKCAHLLRDLAAAVDLPRHSALLSLQLLGLAHRWFEREDNDVLPLAATVCTHIKLNSALAPDPDPFPDPQQPARPLADLLTAIARLSARRQHTAWTIQSTSSLELARRQLGSKSSSSAFPCGVSNDLSSHNVRSSRWSMCMPVVHKALLKFMFWTSPSQWTPGPVKWELRRGFSRVRSGIVSKWLECT